MDRRRAKSWFVAVAVALAALSFADAAFAIQKCGSGKRITCVVDGDTMWLRGEKIRMKGYDTPETTTQICGGAAVRCKEQNSSADKSLRKTFNESYKNNIDYSGFDVLR